jgi:hypothetical protein
MDKANSKKNNKIIIKHNKFIKCNNKTLKINISNSQLLQISHKNNKNKQKTMWFNLKKSRT